MAISPARRDAFEILRRVESEGAFSSALLAAADEDLGWKDRGLTRQLVLGVLRTRLWLDKSIEHFSARSTEKLDLAVLIALRLGLYQLRFLSRVPPSAAVNESVNLIRAAKVSSAASFANAVLRRATREPDYDPTSSIDDPLEQLAVETSHPRWLLARWIQHLGFAEAGAFARANNVPAPLTFRFTARSHHRADELIDELRAAGAELEPSTISQSGWRLAQGANETSVEFLRKLADEGLIYFQDQASQLVAELIGAKPGEQILDVCAAPGSKSTLIAALTADATITAGDLYEHRARIIRQFASQQDAGNISAIAYDATQGLPLRASSFDRVLVDAPCSGTGTLRHNPEIRWRLQPADIDDLATRQRAILRSAAEMVRSGGTLIYSTCSVEIEENEAIVNDFRRANDAFESVPVDVAAGLVGEDGNARTWPHRHDVDGFFVARFQRQSK